MDRDDIAYVVQTCRREFYLLDLHFTLLLNYGARIQWPKYVLCTDNAHYSQQENFYEKYPGVSRIQSLDQIPANIKYICLTHTQVFLEEAPCPDLLEKAFVHVSSSLENVSSGDVYLFRRKNHSGYLEEERLQSLHIWPYRAVDDSLQKWVKEVALQENVFLDDAYSRE
jgi:hypothetical protein